MRRLSAVLAVLLATAMATTGAGRAQSLDDLNIQIHGYATQGFLYSTRNNLFTTSSSDGSPAWTDVVANISAQPTPKLRVSFQGRYFLLGNYGNYISLDYASADYKFDDRLGIRFGKTKVPSGLYNEIQDIDPSYLWSLLPQSVYPIASRNGQLAVYGGVAYGKVALPSKVGKLEYRAWGGEVSFPSDDGYFIAYREAGINLTSGLPFVMNGAALHWVTPLPGLMVGASYNHLGAASSPLTIGGASGVFHVTPFAKPDYFAKYEKNKIMIAAEYLREGPFGAQIQLPGPTAPFFPFDIRGDYAMATYKVTGKLTAGVYDSQCFNKTAPLGTARYSKDWAISGRYDFNQFLYAKAEQHFINGTFLNYDKELNPNGLQPTTKLTILKVGVSF